MLRRIVVALAPAVLSTVVACGTPPDVARERVGSTSAAVSASSIVSIALANVGLGACSANSGGSSAFDSSCTGNGGQPEYWCADFARWVWAQAGASNTSELTAAAGSFYVFGQNHGTLHDTPSLGDAVVFDYQGGGVADHVALVTQVNGDGTIETASGDWNGQSGSEAVFSSTSSVVLNTPAYGSSVGTAPAVMGMTISGYVSPVGVTGAASYGAAFVSQSFPLASTALKMVAGQTLAQTITLKNTGTASWDSSTHLGTTQPRDRASVFADSSWLATNRPAGVTGTVAPGGSYTFNFAFHAPSKPGTYFEYFNLVQEGVAWFSDPGQGGPVDDDLEAQIVVVAAPDDGGTGEVDSDAGAPAVGEDAGAGDPTGSGAPPVTVTPPAPETSDSGAAASAQPAPFAPQGSDSNQSSGSGCAVSRGNARSTPALCGFVLGLVALRSRRRARGKKTPLGSH